MDNLELLWRPWIGHWFPAFTPDRMHTLYLHQLCAMWDFARAE